MSTVSEEIKKIIVEQLTIKDGKVMETSNIADDLGADSLDFIEFISLMEERFDINIPDEDSGKIKTVGDMVSYIEEKVSQR